MSNAEHALENAVYAIEHDIPFEVWKLDINLEYTNATADEVWSMAQWVLFNKCQYCDFRPMEKDEEDDN